MKKFLAANPVYSGGKIRSPGAVLAQVAVVALVLSPAAPALAADDGCDEVSIPVALRDGEPRDTMVLGLLCQPRSPARGAIQVVVSGATEGGLAYWDFPHPSYYRADPRIYRPLRDRYSYAAYLADRGLASLTLDRIGTGGSDHPPAVDVTMESNAYVIHQVVERLRSQGLRDGIRYERVIGTGHSLGAAILVVESATYDDLDGLVIQSYRGHRTPAFAEFPSTFMLAQSEPRFAGRPPGYYTTRPGSRSVLFYEPATEPFVVEHEERTKETVTSGEVATVPTSFEATRQVEVPVLSVVGDRDGLFCSGPGCPEANQERDFFPNTACFESRVIAGSGHQMNLHTNGRTGVFPVLADWVEDNFGSTKLPCPS